MQTGSWKLFRGEKRMKTFWGLGAAACVLATGLFSGCSGSSDMSPVSDSARMSYAAPVAYAGQSVAIMPFVGAEGCPESGLTVAEVMSSELESCSGCEIIAPADAGRRVVVADNGVWDPVMAGRSLGAPYVVTGEVLDYLSDDGDADKPAVTVAARLVDTRTGQVVWNGERTRTGEESVEQLTTRVCNDLALSMKGNLVRVEPASRPAAKPAVVVEDVEDVDGPAVVSTVIEVEDEKPPARTMGEGTADWVVPVEALNTYVTADEVFGTEEKKEGADARNSFPALESHPGFIMSEEDLDDPVVDLRTVGRDVGQAEPPAAAPVPPAPAGISEIEPPLAPSKSAFAPVDDDFGPLPELGNIDMNAASDAGKPSLPMAIDIPAPLADMEFEDLGKSSGATEIIAPQAPTASLATDLIASDRLPSVIDAESPASTDGTHSMRVTFDAHDAAGEKTAESVPSLSGAATNTAAKPGLSVDDLDFFGSLAVDDILKDS